MNYPSHIKKQLQTWSAEAYRREMDREIQRLEKDIAAWKRGKISSEELNHRIHTFDNGPAKALSQQYDYGKVDANVAFALAAGILKKRELPDELLEAIAAVLQTYVQLREKGKLANRKGKWWE